MESNAGNISNAADDTTCIALIQEFLLYRGLTKTAVQLHAECTETLQLRCPSPTKATSALSPEDAQRILNLFNAGDTEGFLKTWEALLPASAHATDPESWRLVFLAHVHGATRSASGVEQLRRFIVEKPVPAKNHPGLLQYYALPYVANPQSHPTFSHLYRESWSKELEASLAAFLGRYSQSSNRPRLLQLTSTSTNHWHSNYKLLKKRFRQLQSDYQRLIGVASELTTALESAVRGETLDLASTLRNCTGIFPELFPQHDAGPKATPEAVLRRSLSQSRQTTPLQTDFELDFRKIRSHLASTENAKTRLLLMQALRWRITHSLPEDREHTVAAVVRHDVLGLQRGGEGLLSLLAPAEGLTPHPLQQGVARLANALASLRAGRDYLCSSQSEQLLPLVTGCVCGSLPGVRLDRTTADMLLALLQKLSLRRKQREAMIAAGLVEWLVPKLEGCLAELAVPDSSTYSLEYGTALLMNLCLHTEAKQRCVPLAGRTLKLLTGMLSAAPRQVLPYVNGTLYSLLSEPLINQQARLMGLEKVLQFYLKQSDDELSRQLEHILRLHRGDCAPEPAESHSEDEGEVDVTANVELLEEELDAGDPVRASGPSELAGEELLKTHYRLLFPAHGVVLPPSSAPLPPPLLTRATTPRLHSPLPLSAVSDLDSSDREDSIQDTSRMAKSPTKVTEAVKDIISETLVQTDIEPDESETPAESLAETLGETVEELEPRAAVTEAEEEKLTDEQEGEEEEEEGRPEKETEDPEAKDKNVRKEILLYDTLEELPVGPRDGNINADSPEPERAETPRDPEFARAFSSRPRIPRTPPLKAMLT